MSLSPFNVRDRVQQMATRPKMYALTREGFVQQLLILLEFADCATSSFGVITHRLLRIGSTRGIDSDHLLELLDDEYAVRAAAVALDVLDNAETAVTIVVSK